MRFPFLLLNGPDLVNNGPDPTKKRTGSSIKNGPDLVKIRTGSSTLMVHKLPTPHVHTNTQSENATGPWKSAKIQVLYIRVQYIYCSFRLLRNQRRILPVLARPPSLASRAFSPCTGPTSIRGLSGHFPVYRPDLSERPRPQGAAASI